MLRYNFTFLGKHPHKPECNAKFWYNYLNVNLNLLNILTFKLLFLGNETIDKMDVADWKEVTDKNFDFWNKNFQKHFSDQDKVTKHRFSEPWENSDLILVVEDEKFHVHRLILTMNSPVFKAMFKSGFQEATNNEIPLPGKKANKVLDFLKQFYMEEWEEIISKLVHSS